MIIPLVFIDIKHRLLPNRITYPGFVLAACLKLIAPNCVLLSMTKDILGLEGMPDWCIALIWSFIGALIGSSGLWLIRKVHFLLRGIEGMGLGDVKMMLMIGAFLGWPMVLPVVLIASLLGSVFGGGILLLLGRKGLKYEIPFGVFLGGAAIAGVFFSKELIGWWLPMYT